MPFTFINNNYYLKTAISMSLLMLGSYFLFSDGLSIEATRSIQALWNLGHVIYFSLLTLIVLKLPYFKNISYFNRCFTVLALTTVLGIGIEALQYGTARNTDLMDVAHDLLGSLIVLAFYRPTLPKTITKKIKVFKAGVLVLTLISLWPLLVALWDETHARIQFPVLSNFSSHSEIKRWTGSAHYKIVARGETLPQSLRIQFNTDLYSGIGLKYFNNNWSHYKNLVIDIYNPKEKSIFITFRVHDKKHIKNYDYNDRFNQHTQIKPGLNQIVLSIKAIQQAPKTRLMDLNHIINFSFFSIKLPNPEILYLNSVYLSQ